jgi:hypothetical protein
MYKPVLGRPCELRYDVHSNGVVNILDVVLLYKPELRTRRPLTQSRRLPWPKDGTECAIWTGAARWSKRPRASTCPTG